MKKYRLPIGILVILGIIAAVYAKQIVIENKPVENNQDKVIDKDITEPLKKLDDVNEKYLKDISYCEIDSDCIFHPGLCQAINQYYKIEQTKPGGPACNLAECGATCVSNKCEIDFSCLKGPLE